MKPRLLLFLTCLVLWTGIYRAFVAPASTLVRQSAAVAATANSDTAYVAQQAVESGSNLPWFFGVAALLTVAFYPPFRFRSNPPTS